MLRIKAYTGISQWSFFIPTATSRLTVKRNKNGSFDGQLRNVRGMANVVILPFLLSVWIIGWESMCILQTKEVAADAERISFFVVYGYMKEVKTFNS